MDDRDIKNFLIDELQNNIDTIKIGIMDDGYYNNAKMILEVLQELVWNEEEDKKIILKEHPMGSLYYEDYKEEI